MSKLVIANWKMNPATLKEAQQMLSGIKRGVGKSKAEIVICPPFVYLEIAKKAFKNSKVKVGSQNCFWENQGPFTGEVSPLMLKNLGVGYVILGHSERVMKMGETNEMTSKKVKAVLEAKLTPIVCLGETLEEKQAGQTFAVIESELKESLAKIGKQQAGKVVFAYEPLWAISTNQALKCSNDDAFTMALFIKKSIGEIYGKKAKDEVRVLYGGNVSILNAKDYLLNQGIDGLLVGNASLNIKEFIDIVRDI